jgi:hypothetical protein
MTQLDVRQGEVEENQPEALIKEAKQRYRRRVRWIALGAALFALIIGTTVLAAGIGNGGHGPSHPGQAQGQNPSLPPSGSPPHAQPTTPSVRPSTSNAVVATPTTTPTTIPPVAKGPATNGTPSVAPQNLVGTALPISVESDAQMQAEGNSGPSSSILVPESCELNGTTVIAEGVYQGGFAPNVYNRYGDIVELYVFGATSAGYPEGPQLAASSVTDSPPIGGYGTWQVSVQLGSNLPVAARCEVAAQPTQDEQLAP